MPHTRNDLLSLSSWKLLKTWKTSLRFEKRFEEGEYFLSAWGFSGRFFRGFFLERIFPSLLYGPFPLSPPNSFASPSSSSPSLISFPVPSPPLSSSLTMPICSFTSVCYSFASWLFPPIPFLCRFSRSRSWSCVDVPSIHLSVSTLATFSAPPILSMLSVVCMSRSLSFPLLSRVLHLVTACFLLPSLFRCPVLVFPLQFLCSNHSYFPIFCPLFCSDSLHRNAPSNCIQSISWADFHMLPRFCNLRSTSRKEYPFTPPFEPSFFRWALVCSPLRFPVLLLWTFCRSSHNT